MSRPRSFQDRLDPIHIGSLRPPFAPTDAASAWLFRLHRLGIRPGLESVSELLERMGQPHRDLPAIVVAGTNGKGTTSVALAGFLQNAGLRVGLYTSPHFLTIHERISVDGVVVSHEELFALVSEYRALIDQAGTTFFESLTALAFEQFRRWRCDVVVLEAGLGGRLDATNVATKIGVVLTSIGLDHQELLGNTEAAIAQEKLGLVESTAPLYLMPLAEELRRQAHARAAEVGTEVVELKAAAVPVPDLLRSSRLRSLYRRVASVAGDLCSRQGWSAPDMSRAAQSFRLAGRFDLRGCCPELILDTAHNAHALVPLLREWETKGPREARTLVLSATFGKDFDGVAAAAMQVASRIVCVAPGWPRAVTPEDLIVRLRATHMTETEVTGAQSVRAGLELARDFASASQGRVLVTGSNFLVAEALDRLGLDSIEDQYSPFWDAGLPLRHRAPVAAEESK